MKAKNVFAKLIKAIVYWGTIIFFVWLLYNNAGDYSKIVGTLKTASYVDLGWGFVLAVGNLALLTAVYRINFKIFQNDLSIGTLLLEIFSFSFVTVSNPLGFNGAMAVTIRRLMEKGYSYLTTFFGFFSTQLAINIGYFPILGLTVWYLNTLKQLTSYEILAAQILLIVNVSIIVLITFILVLPGFSINVSKAFANIANFVVKKLIRKSLVNTENLATKIKEVQDSSKRFDLYFFTFSKSVIVSIIYHLVNVLVLYYSFNSYGYVPGVEILFSLYGIIVLFSVVSPTPQGIGLVEGFAQLAAISMGLESEKALVSILTYRVLTLWIPAFIGFLIFRRFKKQS